MNPICFYHKADLDGVSSAAIVKHFVPECELVGLDYGDEFPWGSVIQLSVKPMNSSWTDYPKRTVYMVDFSLPIEDMKKLAEVSNLIWIDHHASQEELWKSLGCLGMFRTNHAACELVWEWVSLHVEGGNEAKELTKRLRESPWREIVPEAVRLLGIYDSWRKDDKDWDTALAFQYAIRAEEGAYDPTSKLWPFLLGVNGYADSMEAYDEAPWKFHAFDRGKAILRYQAEMNRKACEAGVRIRYLFPKGLYKADHGATYEGFTALCCNTTVYNSRFFDGFYDPEEHDVMCAYCEQSDGRWKVSIYTTKDDVDCGAIAKSFGGGGHKQAAGFICDKLPWEVA